MITAAPETSHPEEFEQYDAETPEVVAELNETPAELATRLQAEVLAQTNSVTTDILPSTQHSIDVIGPDPEIDQRPEMIELMAELKQYIEEARELGEMTKQQLAAAVTDKEQVEDDASPTAPAEGQDETPEFEPSRETPETVEQLLDAWKTHYDNSEDPEMKQELAYCMVKMGEALRAAHLSAGQVRFAADAPGTLGFYNPGTGEVAITLEGINLPPEHFEHVLVHEATHAGKITGKRVSDEGLTELITKKRVANTINDGVYEQEQAQTRDTFSKVDITSVIDTYDFSHPEELISLYFQTEWRDAWNKIKSEIQPGDDIFSNEGRRVFLEDRLQSWLIKLVQSLNTGIPRLVGEAKNSGFNFEQTNLRIFQKLVETEIVPLTSAEIKDRQTST